MARKNLLERGEADTTVGAQIYERLANQIIVGELPPGHRLDEQSLAVQFGVSSDIPVPGVLTR